MNTKLDLRKPVAFISAPDSPIEVLWYGPSGYHSNEGYNSNELAMAFRDGSGVAHFTYVHSDGTTSSGDRLINVEPEEMRDLVVYGKFIFKGNKLIRVEICDV